MHEPPSLQHSLQFLALPEEIHKVPFRARLDFHRDAKRCALAETLLLHAPATRAAVVHRIEIGWSDLTSVIERED